MIDQVLKTSPQRGNGLVVLLALANFADDEGIAWPSMRRLAKESRLGERYLHRVVAGLVSSGELCVERTPGRVNVFRIVFEGVAGGPVLNGRPVAGEPVLAGGPGRGGLQTTPGVAGGPGVGVAGGPPRTVIVNRQLTGSDPSRAQTRAHEPPKNSSDEETKCPVAPHTFTGSYSDHLENDPRHQVRKRD